jgi:hypothetical protein
MDFLKNSRRFTAAAAIVALAALAACERHHDIPGAASTPSPSGVLVGTTPANPSGDPPGTTPIAPNTTDISKTVETTAKPQEGDNHSHSTEATVTPQKADGTNPTSSQSGGRQ